MDGVLRSWAVPKGPSLDPSVKRLAIAVEDHPLEYGGFEGIIPEGQYGGGKVIIWDHGTYECVGKETDPVKAWKEGKIDFILQGKKLKGNWLLIKSHTAKDENQWLFFKRRDEHADTQNEITETAPESVISGLEVEEVSSGGSATWNSRVKKLLEELGAPRREVAAQIRPMLTTLTSKVPEGNAWAYELKYDGVRAIASKKGAEMSLYSRNFNPLEGQFPEVLEELREIPSNHFTLDGEITALDEQGRSRFQLIQPRLGRSDPRQVQQLREKVPAYFFVFDLLACEGYDLRAVPLSERKRILKALLPETPHIRYTEDIRENGKKFLELACGRGLEGIIAKDVNSKYESIRSQAWFKIKCIQNETFVIGGFTRPTGSRKHFGAVVLGLFQDSDLVFVGKSGSGFNQKSLNEMYAELKKRQRKTSPFKEIPREVEREVKGWVKPDLVAEVKFSEWTNDGRLRAPIFMGLRPDVDAKECCAELPAQAAPLVY
ncbi:MAG: non-homologous end-joining DNA ligase [Acidobacteriota bacterium]